MPVCRRRSCRFGCVAPDDPANGGGVDTHLINVSDEGSHYCGGRRDARTDIPYRAVEEQCLRWPPNAIGAPLEEGGPSHVV